MAPLGEGIGGVGTLAGDGSGHLQVAENALRNLGFFVGEAPERHGNIVPVCVWIPDEFFIDLNLEIVGLPRCQGCDGEVP